MKKTMKKIMNSFSLPLRGLGGLLLLAAAIVAGCNKENESPFTGSDNAIAAFSLVQNGVTLNGAISPNTIVVTAPERFSLAGATATVTLSENATITPDPTAITDWNTAQTFTVTAHNGVQQTYTYSVERRLVSRDGDVVLLSQADVETFVATLDADQINGSITVGAATGQDTVYSLAGLEQLRIVTGGIVVNATYAGADLTAFESLETTSELVVKSKKVKTVRFPKLAAVRADLNFDQATAIKVLDFPELTTVDKNLRIYYVDSLASMNFPKLQQVIEKVSVTGRSSGKQNLQAIAFPALQKVGGSFVISYWREVLAVNLPELTDVGGMFNAIFLNKAASFIAPKLETSGDLLIENCAKLTEIDFRALETTRITLTSCTALSEIAFPAMETTIAINISYCTTLKKIDFRALETIQTISISNCAALEVISFPALKTVTGILSIAALASLTNLDAFSAVEHIGQLTLENLAGLASVSLPALTSAGTYNLTGLTALTELDVRGVEVNAITLTGATMSSLTLKGDANFPGKLTFSSPPSGTTAFPVTVEGIENVGELSVSVAYVTALNFTWLKKVDRLLTLTGAAIATIDLSNLQQAGGVSISGCTVLTTLNLPELTAITGYASGTATLGSFSYALTSSNITTVELPELQSVVGNVSITGLTAVRKLATISFPALQSITGTLTITGTSNATFKDLSGFNALTSAAGVTISNFTQLKDFEPLKGLFTPSPPKFAAEAWKISGCGYNPTYQQMVDGAYN